MERKFGTLETVYISVVGLLGVFLLGTHVPRISTAIVGPLFLAILALIEEASPVPIPKGRGTISVAQPLVFTIAVMYGKPMALWTAAVCSLRMRDLKGQVPLRLVLFNRGMLVTSMWVFAVIYEKLGGVFGSFNVARDLVRFIVAACGCSLTNALLFSIEFSLTSGMSIIDVWRLNVIWSLPNMFALFPMGILMAQVCQEGGPLYILLFWIPLAVTKYSLQRYIELRDAYAEVATALSNAIDARDAYTRGHSERVADYAVEIAKEMRLPEDQVELIRYVGLLHDVGKIGIRDAVMKKPGTFTYDEYEEMKQHSQIGAAMLEGMRFLGRGQDWIKYHHERWDGTGFPDHLSGTDIPLGARIIACADSFDAMTTDRPYKKKMSIEEARQELIRCSGTQFDPEVVQAMLKVIDRRFGPTKQSPHSKQQ